MDSLEHQVADLVLELEREMRRLGLWEYEPPPVSALQSTQPFAIDTLRFTQWLQWVFIPRIAALLERDEALPRDCAIAPLAETVFEDLELDTARLLDLLGQMDRRLTR